MPPQPPLRRILILAANPTDTSRLRLDAEFREIQEGLKRSRHADRFELFSQWAVTPDDLRRALLEHEPHIVHFSGHGGGTAGLALDDGNGRLKLVRTRAITGLFKQFPSLECVLLNACYSEVQAQDLVAQVPYVIGMNQAIGDQAALKFAMGFYEALAYNRNYPEAFEFGVSAIDLDNIPETATPVLKVKGRSSAVRLTSPVLTDNQPDTARSQKGRRVFISYRDQAPDKHLAQQFFEALTAAGHQPFMAGRSLRLGETWAQAIRGELEQSDYFLLLLSPGSATSEMVTEEVRQAKRLRDRRQENRPLILPIRVQFPLEDPLNYDLRGYLQQIQQRQWQTEADTLPLIDEVLHLIRQGQGQRDISPQPEETEEPPLAPVIDSVDAPPPPVAEPELKREPGGSVSLKSGLYVNRPPIETDCFEEIMQPGALIRIKAPRQMGKTSLMARILNYAREQGCQAIPLSFQRADPHLFTDLDMLLRWFCEQVGRRLKRLHELDNYWSYYGSKDKCIAYFEECLLANLDQPLVLGLDEVDMVFPHREVADSFFALVRSWYESARYGDFSSELWEKLRLVVVHSTEVYVPLNINQSPFNVGKNVELPEFTFKQMLDLAQRYDVASSASLVEQLSQLVGGHPYLVRKALYHLRRQDASWSELMATAHTEGGIYSDHLRRHLLNLQEYPQLAAALRQVVQKGRPVETDAESAFKLESMGLVTLSGNEAVPRCKVYREYFRDHLE
jgi:serine/threonine-protein kinase